jgi:kynureninase
MTQLLSGWMGHAAPFEHHDYRAGESQMHSGGTRASSMVALGIRVLEGLHKVDMASYEASRLA